VNFLHEIARILYKAFVTVDTVADAVQIKVNQLQGANKNAMRTITGAHAHFSDDHKGDRRLLALVRFHPEPGCETVHEYCKRYE